METVQALFIARTGKLGFGGQPFGLKVKEDIRIVDRTRVSKQNMQ